MVTSVASTSEPPRSCVDSGKIRVSDMCDLDVRSLQFESSGSIIYPFFFVITICVSVDVYARVTAGGVVVVS